MSTSDISKYNYKPGESGNPNGRTKLPETLRMIRPLTHDEMSRVVAKYLRMPVGDVESLNITKLSAIEALIVSVINKSLQNGDTNKREFLLNRCGLRMRDIVEIQTGKFDERLEEIPAEKIVEALRNYKKVNP